MNVNILRYSLFGIAGGQEVDHILVKFIIYPLTLITLKTKINQKLRNRAVLRLYSITC